MLLYSYNVLFSRFCGLCQETPLYSALISSSKDSEKQKKLHPTHFLCIRITDPEIIKDVEGAHNSTLEMEPRYAEYCVSPSTLHITICPLVLDNKEQKVAAGNLLRDCGPELEEMGKYITLTIREVDTFHNCISLCQGPPCTSKTSQISSTTSNYFTKSKDFRSGTSTNLWRT